MRSLAAETRSIMDSWTEHILELLVERTMYREKGMDEERLYAGGRYNLG